MQENGSDETPEVIPGLFIQKDHAEPKPVKRAYREYSSATNIEAGEKPRDVARQELEQHGAFSVRFIEGPCSCLNWQAGVIRQESRHYRGPGMLETFRQTVDLYHLLGHGATLDDALAMARKRSGRNGL